MRPGVWLAFLSLLAAAPAQATPPLMIPPSPAASPALTLVIAVDGLSTAQLDRFRSNYSGGLARLLGGARFDLAPSAESLLGGSVSLSQILDRARPGSRSLVVAGSSGAADALRDGAADQVWLFAGDRYAAKTGAAAPAIVAQANRAIAAAAAAAEPALESPPACSAPPLTTGGKRFARGAGDLAAYRSSPQSDGGTLAFALALARDLGMGSTSTRADLAAIGLGATAAIAAAHGQASEEACLGLMSLDRDLGDAFAYLDRAGIDYAVVMAGVSGEPAPLLFWRKGWRAPATGGPARRIDVAPTIAAMAGASLDPAAAGGACLSGMPGIVCPTKR